MTVLVPNEAKLYLERGGPVQRFVQRVFSIREDDPAIRFRIIGFLAITWLPLLILSILEGRALSSAPKESLLLDFGTYARFFLAVPLLIVAEVVIGPRLRGAGLQFIQGGFVRQEDYPAFDLAIARMVKQRESFWPEVIILAMALAGAWTLTAETIHGGSIASWRAVTRTGDSGVTYSFSGLWYHLVSVPVAQFFLYRWLWRLVIWTRFLWTVSRLNLNLVPSHADQAGGLGFLGTAHTSLGILAFALTCVMSGEVAFLLVFEGASIDSFKVHFIILLVIVQLIILGPLLVFFPVMARTRLAWLRAYSLFVIQYNRAFHEKWIEKKTPAEEPLLGSPDIQSLADLGSSFEYIRVMKNVPFGIRVIIQLAVITSLPCLPLLLLVLPISKILDLLAGAVF